MTAGAISGKDGKIFPFDYKTFTMDNGLKVFVIPTPAQGLVSYYSVVRTGSRDEFEKGYSGFAHFFEHMMFRGTKKYPGAVYDGLTIEMGANANAYTTDDYTCYHLGITKDNLEKVIELESDRFQNLSYEEDPFKTESGAVYGEYRKGKTDPYFVTYEKLYESAFDLHTYRHTTIGYEKDIAAMPTMYKYSINFFKRYYRPENVVIVVTGDVKIETVKPLIESYYKDWKKGYVTPKIETEPEQASPRIANVDYPGKSQPILAIGYKSLAYNPTDRIYVAAGLVADLLFGETSDLYQKLVLREQKVQSLGTEFTENRDPNLNIILTMVKELGDIDYVKNAILDEITSYQTKLVDKDRLAKLKKRIKYGYLMNLDTPDKVAGGLAREIALTADIEGVNIYFTTLAKVTPEDIRTALQKYFTPKRSTIVTMKGAN
jgi:zinc protease